MASSMLAPVMWFGIIAVRRNTTRASPARPSPPADQSFVLGGVVDLDLRFIPLSGAGLVVSDAAIGLAMDVRVRTVLVHQDEDFSERGVSVFLSYNPTPWTPLGFVARVAPSWGGQATSGTEALWGWETMAGMAHGSVAQGNRLDGEVGHGLPVGRRFLGTPRVGFGTSEYGRGLSGRLRPRR